MPVPEGEAEQEQGARPGTSGTEMLLVTNRKQASQHFNAAKEAERTYKTKKRSAAARTNWSDAKAHLGQSGSHFSQGISALFRAMGDSKSVVSHNMNESKAQNEEKKRVKAAEKRAKQEERERKALEKVDQKNARHAEEDDKEEEDEGQEHDEDEEADAEEL
jgi:hypothetical protein